LPDEFGFGESIKDFLRDAIEHARQHYFPIARASTASSPRLIGR